MDNNILALIQISLASGDSAKFEIDEKGIVNEYTNNKGESFHFVIAEVFQHLGDHLLNKESIEERKKKDFFSKKDIGH